MNLRLSDCRTQLATEKYSDQRSKVAYRPDIDGLRALAVVGVMLYHAGFGLTGGFVGVDIFFVISGYLIAQGILRDSEAGQFSLRRFWERRMRRLLPAALVTITVVLVAGYVLLMPGDYDKLARSALSQLFFCGNIYFWLDTGYFTGEADLKPLLHTWSLAVEEQFYFVLPILLSLLLRLGRRVASFSVISLALASFAACVVLTPQMPSASFYLLPTRGWELLVGCCLAFRDDEPKTSTAVPWGQQFISTLALSGLIGSMLMLEADTRFPGYLASIPVACTAVLLDRNRRYRTWVVWLLSLRWLVGIGLISYSLYLWHWPLLAFARYVFLSAAKDLLYLPFLLTFPIAFASWKWIECPCRRRKDWNGRKLLCAVGLAVLLPMTASVVIWHQHGFPKRLAGANVPPPALESLAVRYDTSPIDFNVDELPVLGDRTVEPSFLVWGDSHAIALAPVIDEIASQFGISGRLVARGGAPPLIAAWREDTSTAGRDGGLRWSTNVLESMHAREWKAILVIAGWQIYVHETGLVDAQRESTSSDTAAEVFSRQLQRTAAAMPSSSRIFWLQPAPRQSTDLARALRNRALYAWSPEVREGLSREQYQEQMTEISRAFRSLSQLPQHTWVEVTSKFFNERGEATLFDDAEFCYIDDNHVSQAGAKLYFSEAIREIVQGLVAPQSSENRP
jgi:peptidoglycan/LPS O-acetylase OafA/YrhL